MKTILYFAGVLFAAARPDIVVSFTQRAVDFIVGHAR